MEDKEIIENNENIEDVAADSNDVALLADYYDNYYNKVLSQQNTIISNQGTVISNQEKSIENQEKELQFLGSIGFFVVLILLYMFIKSLFGLK